MTPMSQSLLTRLLRKRKMTKFLSSPKSSAGPPKKQERPRILTSTTATSPMMTQVLNVMKMSLEKTSRLSMSSIRASKRSKILNQLSYFQAKTRKLRTP